MCLISLNFLLINLDFLLINLEFFLINLDFFLINLEKKSSGSDLQTQKVARYDPVPATFLSCAAQTVRVCQTSPQTT